MKGSLNDIMLDNTLLAGLYGHSLVELSGSRRTPVADNPVPGIIPGHVKFLGNNLRNILVIVNDPEHAFLAEQHLAFLTKMLGACQLNTGDVAIVNTANTDPAQAIKELKPLKIITLGADFEMPDSYTFAFIASPSLEKLTGDSEEARLLKGKLWAGLKQLFGI